MINSNINTYICNKYIERKNIKIEPTRIENLKEFDKSSFNSLRSYSIQNAIFAIFLIFMIFLVYFITEATKKQEDYNEFNSTLLFLVLLIILLIGVIWLAKTVITNENFIKKIKVEIRNNKKEVYEIKSSSSIFYNNLEGVGSFYNVHFEGNIDTYLILHESQMPQIKGEEFIIELLPKSGLILNIQNKKIQMDM
jgi:amino acid transporter